MSFPLGELRYKEKTIEIRSAKDNAEIKNGKKMIPARRILVFRIPV
jgi:hypothetical protein